MPATLDLNKTFGAFLIGVVVSAVLFGVLCVQTFYYFQNYGSDKILVKTFVLMILILESLHYAVKTYAIYYYTIINYFNPVALITPIWPLTSMVPLSGAIVFLIHIFYIRRVYYMSHKHMSLVALILGSALIASGMIIFVSVEVFQIQDFSAFTEITSHLTAGVAVEMAADIIIAGSLSWFLHKSRSGMQKSDTLINQLMMYTINNGVFSCIFGILIIIFEQTQPQNMISVSLFIISSNLHTNSALATLNSRRSMTRAYENTSISFRLPISAVSVSASASGFDYTKPVQGDSHIGAENVVCQPTSECITNHLQ